MSNENNNMETFIKMNGAGNTFLLHDSRKEFLNVDKQLINKLGIFIDNYTFDQFIQIVSPERDGDIHVNFWNADGSKSSMCGNALRCVGHIVQEEKNKDKVILETVDKDIECWKQNDEISINIGSPELDYAKIPLSQEIEDTKSIKLDPAPCELPNFSAINVGNPHAIFFFDNEQPKLEEVGNLIENHEMFPDKVNVSFAKIENRNHISVNVWERGTGITKACGSAACATAVAGSNLGLTDRKVTISFIGGDLKIDWKEDNNIIMTGPFDIEQEIEIDLLEL